MRNIVATALAVLVAGFASVRADTIAVRADIWMPYNGEPASDRPGYCVELLKAVFEPAGHKIDYQVMPWTRDLEDVQADRIDAVICASTKECPKALFPAETVGVNQSFYFVRKGDPWAFKGLDSLKEKYLGVIDGYAYDDGELDGYVRKGEAPFVQKATGDEALEKNIRKLLAGRLDALVENDLVLKEALVRLGLAPDLLVQAGKANTGQELYIAFAPGREGSKAYARTWDEGVRRLRGNGELKKLLERYGLKDWK